MVQRPPRILVTGSSLFFSARLIHDLGRRGAVVTAADIVRALGAVPVVPQKPLAPPWPPLPLHSHLMLP